MHLIQQIGKTGPRQPGHSQTTCLLEEICLAGDKDISLHRRNAKLGDIRRIREQEHAQVRRRCPVPGSLDSGSFDTRCRRTNTSHVEEGNCDALEIHPHLEDIPGRARLR